MLARVCSAAITGIDAFAVEVEVNCGYGETFIALIGLPAVSEEIETDQIGLKKFAAYTRKTQ